MRAIYKIAKTELQMLFYSPIAWLLLLCFVFQTVFFYTGMLEGFVLDTENTGRTYWCSLRLFIRGYGGGSGLWPSVVNILYLYIPLLTMGVISKELSSGSIKLLYSSPISNAHIVLGKFLAMVAYAFLLTLVLFVYVLFAWCMIDNFEWAWVLTGLLGIFLLACTYMAVGIFVSSLTSYQVISAVGTFIVLMLLGMVSGWGQQYDFVREITYWLGMNGRVSTFIDGMLCSEDLIYFPTVIALFLMLTIIRLHAIRQKQKFTITLYKNCAVIAMVCLIAFVSSRPALLVYVDTTATKQNTLTPVSQEIVDKLDGGLTITSYVNLLDQRYGNYAYPHFIMHNRKVSQQFTRFKPETKLKVVYYYADPNEGMPGRPSAWQQARRLCEVYEMDSTMFLSRAEVDKMADLASQGYRFVREAVRENGQREWLYDFTGRGLLEEGATSVALKRMVMEVPKIEFVKGHRERKMYGDVPYDMGHLFSSKWNGGSMVNQGFDVVEVTLDQDALKDVDLLWIADMRTELTPEEEAALEKYIEQGGNLVFMGEPSHRETQNKVLNKFFGLELTPLLVGPDVRFKGSLTANVLAAVPTQRSKELMYPMKNSYRIAHENCAGIEEVENKGFKVEALVSTDTTGPVWTELETTDFVDDTVKFNPTVGEISKVFNTVVGLTRQVGNREQRIMVTGDADCLSNNEFVITRGVSAANVNLLTGCALWMTSGELPLDMRRPDMKDNSVSVSMAWYRVFKAGFKFGLPILLLGIGVFIWFRRRGR